MKRKVIFGSFLMAGLLVAGSNAALAQQKKDDAAKAEAQTCEEFLSKPAPPTTKALTLKS